MDVVAELERARQAHAQHAWADAYQAFSSVDEVTPLAAGDLELLGEACDLVGRGDDVARVLQGAYRSYADSGELAGALRCAFWLSRNVQFNGEFAKAGAWIARAARLTAGSDCAERGYLLIPEAEQQAGAGDDGAASATCERIIELGTRCRDADLVALATTIQGRVRIQSGRPAEGLAMLDEAMLSVTAGETSARIAGWIYCMVIDACHQLHEVSRAREWTTALNNMCDTWPQFTGAYSGICRVHRAELLQSGAWPDAAREAKEACDQLSQGYGHVVAGFAFNQLGEVHRLRGRNADADDAYQRACELGWDAQPGLALLRLAQGKVDAAAAAIQRALTEATNPLARSRLLPAAVEIMLAAQDVTAARDGATELTTIGEQYGTPALRAHASHARGAVELADGAAERALPMLREAWQIWSDLDAPYEAARARALIGLACRVLHDEDGAKLELSSARRVLHELGAAPDVARLDAFDAKHPVGDASGLSARQIEVLRLLAAGKTNRAIATELFLSEKTVDRHVSNIFAKLGVGSRTAAATYAFEHHLS